MFRIPIALSTAWLWLTAGFCITEAAGQENSTDSTAQTLSPRIVWQQELEGEIRTRPYLGHVPHYPNLSEPNVGISLDSTRANPVSMVATDEWLYLFDGEGQIERSIPIEKDPAAITDPKGRFYITQWINIYAYNADGSLRFEIKDSPRGDPPIYLYGEKYISPNGEYLLVFYNGWDESPFVYLYFFHTTTGALLRYVSDDDFTQLDFDPFGLTFLGDGSQVLLTGFKTKRVLIFDDQGDLIQLPENVRAKLTTDSPTQLSTKQAVYRQLVDPQAPLDARPDEVRDIKMLTDRKGVYTSGNTLYLFELQSSP